jgi:hypothetical protein
MLEMLVCFVAVIGNVPEPVETEECFTVKTQLTENAYCKFVSGFAWGNDNKVTYCRPARGRVKPNPMFST